jgi:hypothetical protein
MLHKQRHISNEEIDSRKPFSYTAIRQGLLGGQIPGATEMTDNTEERTLKLKLYPRRAYLSVVTRFVEAGAAAFGMEEKDALNLSLAAEEIFLYLCAALLPDNPMDIDCFNGIYYTRLTFNCSAPKLDLRGLNIASAVTFEDEGDLRDMGLMIASRSVERLHLTVKQASRISLAVTKEKTYPKIVETLPCPEAPNTLTLEMADGEVVKQFALLVVQCSAAPDLPSFFERPGRLVDMIAGGEYRLITALNEKNGLVGGLLFRNRSERIIEAFGPYILHAGDGTATAEALLDACLNRIARTKALGLLSRSGLPPVLEARFETLGHLIHHAPNRPPASHPFFFRHLHEDPGCDVWSQGELTAWLEQTYARLVLARNIKTLRDMGETRSGFSLLSAELRHERADAILRPLLPGADFAVNLERHICFIRKEGFLNLFFELDLGISWHAEMIPVLTASRFQPQILLPFAGQADLVIFQHHDATEP